MTGKWKKIDRILIAATHIYLLLPVLIFCIGWCKWYVGIIMTCVTVIGAYMSMRQYASAEAAEAADCFWDRKSLWKILIVVLIIVLWVILSGIGGYVWQNKDHWWRNVMFNILVEDDWPVVRSMEFNGIACERGMIYYIGFWLPAALAGKLFGLEAGYAFQCVWAVMGIVIFYFLICSWRKKISVWPLFIFIFFSGLDIIGALRWGAPVSVLWSVEHLEAWSVLYQYSSITTQLFWVFNQALPAWVACALLFLRPHPRNCILIWVSTMLTSTLPFMGLLPYVVYIICKTDKPMCEYGSTMEYFKAIWKRLVSVPNIVCGGAIGLLSAIYLAQNDSGRIMQKLELIPPAILAGAGICFLAAIVSIAALAVHGHSKVLTAAGVAAAIFAVLMWLYCSFREYPTDIAVFGWKVSVWFYLLEAGIFLLLLRQEKGKAGLWWLCVITLLVCPLIKIGTSIDFCMRASIPSLVLIYFWVIKKYEKGFRTVGSYILCAALTVGGVTSLHEITRTIVYSSNPYIVRNVAEEAIFTQGNFSGEVTGIFWEYLAK